MPGHLETLRKQRDLSRAEVARQLDISERHLYRIEKGQARLRLRYATQIAALYEVPESEVVNGASA